MMASPALSCLALLLLASCIGLLDLCMADSEYPGVIELVGYNSRRARTHYMPVSFKGRGRPVEVHTYAPPPAKMQADIETVKQNIEKYNKLLTLDTKNLPESQKDMLERIVERVARLKESLDVGQTTTTQPNRTSEAMTSLTTEASTDVALEAETDPSLLLDETTLLQLQTSMDEFAAAQATVTAETTHMRELPLTTERTTDVTGDDASDDDGPSVEYESTTNTLLTDSTDADQQFVAARSNNRNIAAITAADVVPSGGSSTPLTTSAGNQRTLTTIGKAQKTRATKRPLSSSSTKATSSTTSKRVGGQRPGSSTVALHKQTTTKQKLAAAAAAAITTAQPNQKVKVQQQYNQQKVTEKFAITPTTPNDQIQQHQRTPQAGGTLGAGAGAGAQASAAAAAPSAASYGAGTEMIYDAHVNTSAIIDSLNQAREEFYQHKHSGSNKDKKPSATAKPTKYHYYPHNQHIYMLPECAIQQVCNAVYVRLNYTQPLCACPSRYRDPCSASLNEDDQHTTKLVGDGKKKAITLAKTCEDTKEMRECRSPKDWSLLALQNTRTGKSHYLVICRCPDHFKMEGPMAHDQPTYASVPGIRVFGMMCVKPGFAVRKPSVQPPKRYQLQKPYYRPNVQSPSTFSNGQYVNKDPYGRPMYGGAASSSTASLALGNNNDNNGYHHHQSQNYQNQHHSNYQYLNRPEHSHNNNYHHSETLGAIGGFNGGSIYGRNNERKGETPIQAAATEAEDEVFKTMVTSTPAAAVESRTTDSDVKMEGTEEAVTVVVVPVAAATPVAVTNSVTPSKREKRSLVDEVSALEDDSQMPEFPWDRVIEFQQSVVWD